MGKKDKQLKQEIVQTIKQGSRVLERSKLKKIAKPLKQLLWSEAKTNNISHKTENLLNSVINDVLGEQNVENEFDFLFRQSEKSYQSVRDLFQKGSLKERFGNLVQISDQVHQSQSVSNEQLSQQEQQWLKRVKKVYQKYRVSSIYKHNLAKKINKRIIQKLINKGCLQQICTGIVTLVT